MKRDGEGGKVIPSTPVHPRLREVVETSCYIPQVIFSLGSAPLPHRIDLYDPMPPT